MFDTNKSLFVDKFSFKGSTFYKVDNFFKEPNRIVDYLNSNEPELWKKEQGCFYNGIKYFDKRHFIPVNPFKEFALHISGLTNFNDECYSNCMTFIDKEYNNYKDNFWFPHCDDNQIICIVYLNESYKGPGTNIYSRISDDYTNIPEHMIPWRSRSKYNLELQIQSKFNRFVMFDGNFLHGAAIEDDTFFYEERKNIVSFFKK